MDGDLETLVVGFVTVIAFAGLVGSVFYFAARAERRRKEHAAPDALDVVDAILMVGADFASPETRRRYHDPKP